MSFGLSLCLLLLAVAGWSQADSSSAGSRYLPNFGAQFKIDYPPQFSLYRTRSQQGYRPTYAPSPRPTAPRPTYPPQQPQQPKIEPPRTSYQLSGGCQYRGQYLVDPTNHCNYRRCVVRVEPWRQNSVIPLDAVSSACAPGTAVPRSYVSGQANPCTELDATCNTTPVSKREPTYRVDRLPQTSYRRIQGKSYKPAGDECQVRGQILRDPTDKCKYRRCVVKIEPWEVNGVIPLDIVTLSCAPGSAVPEDFQGGYRNPCSVADDSCGGAPKSEYPPPAPEFKYPPPPPPQPEQPVYKQPVLTQQPVQTYKPEEPIQKPKEPVAGYGVTGACRVRGQYLRDPTNNCQYRRCVVRIEPWMQNGVIPLDIITEKCAPGTAVPADFEEGTNNPCTESSSTCGAKSAPSSYQPVKEEMSYQPMPMPQPSYPPQMETQPASRSSECHARGQHLRDPEDKCKYRRCVVMIEPWEVNGRIPLDVITLSCAPGTAVPADYQGGYINPCTEVDESCGAKSMSYEPVEPPKKMEEPRYPPKMMEMPTYPPKMMEEEQPEAPSYEPKVMEQPSYPPKEMRQPSYPPKMMEMPAYPPKMMEEEKPQTPSYEPIPVEEQPSLPRQNECHARGQHLRDPEDKCKYRRCVVMIEPWEVNGMIPLDIITLSCAPGSAVPADYQGGYANPCTIADESCGVSTPKTSYQPKEEEPPKVYPRPTYPPKMPEPIYPPQPVKEQPMYPPMSGSECHARGQHLRDPEDKCKYRRCVVMVEPWEVNGMIPLDIITLSCAPGSAVPADYQGGYANPCTIADESCGALKKYYAPTAPAPTSPPKLETSYFPQPIAQFLPPIYPLPMPSYPPMMPNAGTSKSYRPETPVPTYAPAPTDPPKMANECHVRGQHLRDPEDKCNYRRCVVMIEPWEVNGMIPLDVITLSCAPGSAVPADYQGGYANPCTVADESCGAPSKSYQPPEPSAYPPEEEAPTYPPKVEQSYPPPAASRNNECHARGQHLRDPEDKCNYRRCVVMIEPWEVNGMIPLDVITLSCAPGSAVPADYQGGYANPCTVADESCGAPAQAPKTSYEPQRPVEPVVMTYKPKPQPEVQTYQPIAMIAPTGECRHRGQLLPHPSDKCKYRQCVVMKEPWAKDGMIPLDIITLSCAPGSAVASDFNGGYSNPCTVIDSSCGATNAKTRGYSR